MDSKGHEHKLQHMATLERSCESCGCYNGFLKCLHRPCLNKECLYSDNGI